MFGKVQICTDWRDSDFGQRLNSEHRFSWDRFRWKNGHGVIPARDLPRAIYTVVRKNTPTDSPGDTPGLFPITMFISCVGLPS